MEQLRWGTLSTCSITPRFIAGVQLLLWLFGDVKSNGGRKSTLAYEAEHMKHCIRAGLTTGPVVTEARSVAGIEVLEKVETGWW